MRSRSIRRARKSRDRRGGADWRSGRTARGPTQNETPARCRPWRPAMRQFEWRCLKHESGDQRGEKQVAIIAVVARKERRILSNAAGAEAVQGECRARMRSPPLLGDDAYVARVALLLDPLLLRRRQRATDR
uniref:Uncharacterized protein n=1 Tax=Plectus sambesii TaxID=2011161 RepID=A0A914W080_9BILA